MKTLYSWVIATHVAALLFIASPPVDAQLAASGTPGDRAVYTIGGGARLIVLDDLAVDDVARATRARPANTRRGALLVHPPRARRLNGRASVGAPPPDRDPLRARRSSSQAGHRSFPAALPLFAGLARAPPDTTTRPAYSAPAFMYVAVSISAGSSLIFYHPTDTNRAI